MCGRFTLTFTLEQIAEEFDISTGDLNWQPSYNVAPSHRAPVILQSSANKLSLIRWGIQMHIRKINQVKMVINIRKETIVEKQSFNQLILNNRCLILADGFYEWEKTRPGNKKNTPYYFFKDNKKIMAFAGLWDEGKELEGGGKAFAIITCPANQTVGKIHDRMPVILDKVEQERWLEGSSKQDLYPLLSPYPDEKIGSYMVSPRMNNTDYNNLDCINPVTIQQPGLGY